MCKVIFFNEILFLRILDMKCYGEMEISLNKWDSGTGTANCRPITTTGAPQGYIADGEDGSHWVN